VAGLYKPSYGNVYIDGQPLSRWNAQSLRSQIALVALDDSLLQGDDIERMPMGYECLVVDMSTLKLC
jgi:ABC-type bacteriocin/lantibiotic exporter with double-glycine peptidase domain